MKPSVLLAGLGLVAAPVSAAEVWPAQDWASASPEEVMMDGPLLERARDYALSAGGSGLITRHGKRVLAWGDPHQRYDLKSSTKSFGSIALGLAITDGRIGLGDPARKHHPDLGVPPGENAGSGWLDEIKVIDLASQTAGFEKPGGYTRQLFRPGTLWDYSDSGPNWLAECLTLIYRRDLEDWMFERVFTPLGISRADLTWRRNQYRPALIDGVARREFGAGIHASVDAMARVGLLMLRGGRWRDRQLVSAEYVALAPRPVASHAGLPVHANSLKEMGPDAPRHYGLLWWNNADGTLANVPRDAYWSWGLYDSLIFIVPSLDLVVARTGRSWDRRPGGQHYDPLRPFLEPLVAACLEGSDRRASVSRSRQVTAVRWAPRESIRRAAPGSDNWPLTWADDDALYGAYGDGRGFEPFVDSKLSLGLVRVDGGPGNFQGTNLRAPSLEQRGDGPAGRKASGLLFLRDTLYLFARNAGAAQLAWSTDHGRHWTWADWKFTGRFGCPTLLNEGKAYAGNTDGYVYVISPDSDDAYTPADQFLLARVPVDRVTDRAAYEFYSGPAESGEGKWSAELQESSAILRNPGRCYRPAVTFNPGLGRFLLVHAVPDPESQDPGGRVDSRFRGGLAIYEAPRPWGPWSTVFETAAWDVGPGDSASFPAKWISPDGRTAHLVFSGEDTFAVRRVEFERAN